MNKQYDTPLHLRRYVNCTAGTNPNPESTDQIIRWNRLYGTDSNACWIHIITIKYKYKLDNEKT